MGLKKDFACVDAALWVIEPVMAEGIQEQLEALRYGGRRQIMPCVEYHSSRILPGIPEKIGKKQPYYDGICPRKINQHTYSKTLAPHRRALSAQSFLRTHGAVIQSEDC